ncbi:hypothetical protein F441_04360, partial [Phytophthora nicotianae CJ01A1]
TNIKCAATNLKLFLVKKSDAWLPHNENLDMLLQSKIDTSSYLRMRGSWKLSRPELFGPGVSLGEDVRSSRTGGSGPGCRVKASSR